MDFIELSGTVLAVSVLISLSALFMTRRSLLAAIPGAQLLREHQPAKKRPLTARITRKGVIEDGERYKIEIQWEMVDDQGYKGVYTDVYNFQGGKLIDG